MHKKPVKILFQSISILLTIGVVYFAYVYGRDLITQADFSGLAGNYWLLILAFLGFLLFYAIMAVHWLWVCRLVQADVPSKQVLSFFAAQPYKYLPTSLFTFSFRAKFAKQLGLRFKYSTYAQLLENFNVIGAALVMGVVFYVVAYWPLYAVALMVAAILVVVVVHKNKLTITIPKVRKVIPVYRMIPAFLLACSAWVAGGVAFLLVNYALGLSPNILLVFAANAVGYAFSILAFFAPGGIGVREFILALFSIQNSAIVMWRLLTFAADLVVGVCAIAVVRVVTRKKTVDSNPAPM